MASRKKKKTKQTGVRRALRGLYRFAVVLSAFIVMGFVAWNILISPPAQSAAPPPMATVEPGQEAFGGASLPAGDEVSTVPAPKRRDYTYTFLLAASDQSSGNADTIMVLTYDVPNGTVGVVSIPRDTLVNRKSPKINGAFLGQNGAETLKGVVSNLMGFPIDYYITVNIKGFKALVEEVGGVEFYVPCDMDYDDPTQDLYIHFKQGTQYLNGEDALKVVRFRHNNDFTGYNDTGRVQTQRDLLSAVAKKVLSLSSLTKFNRFVDIFTQYVKTDMTASDIAYFASNALSLDLDNGMTSGTLPGDGSVTYRGTKWCYRLYPEESLAMLNEIVNPYTTELTLSMVNFFQG